MVFQKLYGTQLFNAASVQFVWLHMVLCQTSTLHFTKLMTEINLDEKNAKIFLDDILKIRARDVLIAFCGKQPLSSSSCNSSAGIGRCSSRTVYLKMLWHFVIPFTKAVSVHRGSRCSPGRVVLFQNEHQAPGERLHRTWPPAWAGSEHRARLRGSGPGLLSVPPRGQAGAGGGGTPTPVA